jgi:hypothetical protein
MIIIIADISGESKIGTIIGHIDYPARNDAGRTIYHEEESGEKVDHSCDIGESKERVL